jgi:hypothetical protein
MTKRLPFWLSYWAWVTSFFGRPVAQGQALRVSRRETLTLRREPFGPRLRPSDRLKSRNPWCKFSRVELSSTGDRSTTLQLLRVGHSFGMVVLYSKSAGKQPTSIAGSARRSTLRVGFFRVKRPTLSGLGDTSSTLGDLRDVGALRNALDGASASMDGAYRCGPLRSLKAGTLELAEPMNRFELEGRFSRDELGFDFAPLGDKAHRMGYSTKKTAGSHRTGTDG